MKKIMVCLMMAVALSGCGTTGGRVSTQKGDDMMVTDKWTKVDSDTAAKQIVEQFLTSLQVQEYIAQIGRKPKLFVMDISNQTADPDFRMSELNNAILKLIINSGEFVLIDNQARDKINAELAYQRGGAVIAGDIQKIEESGADTLIFGEITMEPIINNGQTVKEYTVNMRMTNVRTKEEIVRTDYTVTKYTKRSAFGW